MANPRSSSWTRRSGVAIGLALALTLAWPSSALCADAPAASKTVAALLAAAQKQLDAGNFERAAELFLEIWRVDKTTVPALYNAARSFQLAGQLDKSERLFREMLALADLDPQARAKAQAQLDAVLAKKAERRADEAAAAESAGQYDAAVALWAEALTLDPKRVEWLKRLGRAAHLGGKHPQALAAYDRFLKSPGQSAADKAQVEAWRAELTRAHQTASALEAADADHLAGNLESAAHRYAAVVADPSQPAETRAKAQERLGHVQRQLALRKADVAGRAESEGQFGLAAELWAEAFELDPSQHDWLRRQGRALHVAGRAPAAIAAYDRYLQRAPAEAPERAQVVNWRNALVLEGKPPQLPAPPAPVAPKPVPLPVVTAPSEPPPSAAPKVLTVMGLVAAIGGGTVWLLAETDRKKLDDRTWGRLSAGERPNLSYAEATRQAKDIALRRTVGVSATAAGGGLALIGVLAWALRGDPPPAQTVWSVVPDLATGAAVQVRW